MLKLIKIILWVVIVLITIAVGGGLLVWKLIDPNDYRSQIESLVEKKVDRDLSIRGDLGLSFFPWLGLSVEDVSLGNRPGFGDEPMVNVQQMNIQVQVVPLLKQKIEVDTILLVNPVVRLLVDETGATNWAGLVKGENEKSDAQVAVEEAQSSSENWLEALAGLVIQGVSIENGQIQFSHSISQQHIVVDGANLSTQAIIPGEPLGIQLSGSFSQSNPKLETNFEGATTVHINNDLSQVILEKNRLTLRPLNPADSMFTWWSSDLGFNAERITIDRSAGEVYGSPLQLSLANDQLIISDWRVSDFSDPAILSSVSLLSESPLDWADRLMNIEFGHHRVADLNLSARLEFSDHQLTMNSLQSQFVWNDHPTHIKLPFLEWSGQGQSLGIPSLSIEQGRDNLALESILAVHLLKDEGRSVTGKLSLDLHNPAEFFNNHHFSDLPWLPGERFTTSLDINVKNRRLDLDNLAVSLDPYYVKGAFSVTDMSSPGYEFDLESGALSIDALLESAGENGEAKPSSSEAALLPIAALRGLDVNGRLQIDSLVVSNITMDKLALQIASDGNVLTVAPFAAQLYEGTVGGDLRYDVTDDQADVFINAQFQNVQLAGFLQDLSGSERLEGVGQLRSALRGRGMNSEELLSSLGGELIVDVVDGAVRGFDLQGALVKAKNLVSMGSGKEMVKTNPNDKTRFAELGASFQIDQGIMATEDFAMKAPAFRLRGLGEIDLVNQDVDFRLNTHIVETSKGQGGKNLEDLKGLRVPLKVTGPLADPDYRLDLETIVTDRAKAELKKSIEAELDDELNKQLGQELEERAMPESKEQLEDQLKNDAQEKLKEKLKNSLLKRLGS